MVNSIYVPAMWQNPGQVIAWGCCRRPTGAAGAGPQDAHVTVWADDNARARTSSRRNYSRLIARHVRFQNGWRRSQLRWKALSPVQNAGWRRPF